MYEITAPSGRVHKPAPNTCWKVVRETLEALIAEDRITFGADGNGVPRRKYFLSEAEGMVPWSWWPHEDVGHTGQSKNEIVKLFGTSVFDTPKPERLIERILHIATNPGELVLDSFLGSGTTAAVAHKMGRRWIGVEMGDHARTHCAVRMQKVIEGEQGGVSKAVGWEGGGGFRFCTLGEAVFDAGGKINPAIRFADLARHVWFSAFKVPMGGNADGPFLGAHDGRGLALLYNGILKDRSAGGGNVLTHAVLRLLREQALVAGWVGPITVYGAASRLADQTLEAAGVTFRQTPYDIKARG